MADKKQKSKPVTTEAASSPEPDCLQMLKEFVLEFAAIPQKYCLFCGANTSLGWQAHKPKCTFAKASKLLAEKPKSAPK